MPTSLLADMKACLFSLWEFWEGPMWKERNVTRWGIWSSHTCRGSIGRSDDGLMTVKACTQSHMKIWQLFRSYTNEHTVILTNRHNTITALRKKL